MSRTLNDLRTATRALSIANKLGMPYRAKALGILNKKRAAYNKWRKETNKMISDATHVDNLSHYWRNCLGVWYVYAYGKGWYPKQPDDSLTLTKCKVKAVIR